MYRVIEVSRMLGVSKVTIYKKIDKLKKELKGHTKKISNILYIDETGVEIIKLSLELVNKNLLFDKEMMDNIEEIKISNLENYIEMLTEQSKTKKNQINKCDDIISKKEKMIKLLS